MVRRPGRALLSPAEERARLGPGRVLRLEPARPDGRILVFLPGFLSAASSYFDLLEPLTRHGFSVVVPQLYRRGFGALTGRVTVQQEAIDAAGVVRAEAASDGRIGRVVALGGHSRGGQAAWRAAELLVEERLPAALVLVDPVDGAGRRRSVPSATVVPPRFDGPCLIVGAGIGGRCAPATVNHEVFARAAPAAHHVVVPALGHGDVLDDRSAARARRLCGGAADPAAGRARVTALVAELLASLPVPG